MKITGHFGRATAHGYDDDLLHAGEITIVKEYTIRVPRGLMADCVRNFFGDEVTVICAGLPGALTLHSIDYADEDDDQDEDEAQAALAI